MREGARRLWAELRREGRTDQWSSEFARREERRYDFAHYSERLKMIHRQEDLVRAFIATTGIKYGNVYYEDLTTDPASVVKFCFGVDLGGSDRSRTPAKAGDAINEDFVQRLASDPLYGPK